MTIQQIGKGGSKCSMGCIGKTEVGGTVTQLF